jgi:hypothetical protein
MSGSLLSLLAIFSCVALQELTFPDKHSVRRDRSDSTASYRRSGLMTFATFEQMHVYDDLSRFYIKLTL